jgi:hypothetical protein
MSYLDKTFCASPNCTNDCGHRMTDEEHQRLIYLNDECVYYAYFCGDPNVYVEKEFDAWFDNNT